MLLQRVSISDSDSELAIVRKPTILPSGIDRDN